MPMIPPAPRPLDRHAAIEALLPWYANGTLTPVETAAVEQHLTHCHACRAEVARCRTLATAIGQENQREVWQPAPDGFDRLLAQIDQLEGEPTSAVTRRPRLLERLSVWLGATPNPVRWTLALESLAVAALLLVIALPGTRLPSDYETLSGAPRPPAATGPRLRIVFADAATAKDIQSLLQEIDGSIVAGPTALGVYPVPLPAGARSDQVRAAALGTLRARHHVRLAEAATDGDHP